MMINEQRVIITSLKVVSDVGMALDGRVQQLSE